MGYTWKFRRLSSSLRAEVAELADAQASGACGRKVVEVQILSSANQLIQCRSRGLGGQLRVWCGHIGLCVLAGFVQRLCNGGAVSFQLFHRCVKPSEVDVEVAARRGQVGVPEDFAHQRDRNSRLLKARPRLVTQVAELQPAEPSAVAGVLPRRPNRFGPATKRVPKGVGVIRKRLSCWVQLPHLKRCQRRVEIGTMRSVRVFDFSARNTNSSVRDSHPSTEETGFRPGEQPYPIAQQ